MILAIILLLLLNISFMVFLWHMDVNHNLDCLGEKKTRGIWKMPPETWFRLSEYGLIATLFSLDLLVILLLRL